MVKSSHSSSSRNWDWCAALWNLNHLLVENKTLPNLSKCHLSKKNWRDHSKLSNSRWSTHGRLRQLVRCSCRCSCRCNCCCSLGAKKFCKAHSDITWSGTLGQTGTDNVEFSCISYPYSHRSHNHTPPEIGSLPSSHIRKASFHYICLNVSARNIYCIGSFLDAKSQTASRCLAFQLYTYKEVPKRPLHTIRSGPCNMLANL